MLDRRRSIYEAEHELFRRTVQHFVKKHIDPFDAEWRTVGKADRKVWRAAGDVGLLCPQTPTTYGGQGNTDYRYQAILMEEIRSPSIGFGLQTGVTANYIINFGTEQQKQRFLPPMISGECIVALAITEPDAGSDIRGIASTLRRCGDGWRLCGRKTFISSALLCDAVIVACMAQDEGRDLGLSLVLVESNQPGFLRGKKLKKLGRHGADTAELFFDDVHIVDAHVLGAVGAGMRMLTRELPAERLAIAISAVADAQRALDITLEHCKQRKLFGARLMDFQNSRFRLADCAAQLDAAWAYLDQCIEQQTRGTLSAERAAAAKLWTTEMQVRVMDECVQLFGGYGYMEEYEIARLYADARVQRIYGGASEVMREIVARALDKAAIHE